MDALKGNMNAKIVIWNWVTGDHELGSEDEECKLESGELGIVSWTL